MPVLSKPRKAGRERMPFSIGPAIAELERAHRHFNRELFVNRLTYRLVVTIQSAGKRRAHGWYGPGFWRNGRREPIAELNLSAEDLRRPAEDLMEVLIHEMSHQASIEAGIRDTCDRGRYHNALFKKAAEEAGLICTHVDGHGWAETALGPRARAAVTALDLSRSAFAIARLREGSRPKIPTKLAKWVCACGFGVRVARHEFHAMCLDCGEQFVRAE